MSENALSEGQLKTPIVIAGMARGGTSLAWNVIQSHPAIIDSYFELNEIFGKKTQIAYFSKSIIELGALTGLKLPGIKNIIERRLAKFSRYSFYCDDFNREKSPGVLYQEDEYENLVVCTKLVSSWETNFFRKTLRRNDALKYLNLMKAMFGELKTIFVIRNGLAVAEGWMRRGANIAVATYWYRKYVKEYEYMVEKNADSNIIVRFEDFLEDPFITANNVFKYLSLEADIKNLRIAIKPTVRANKSVENTTKKNKEWISPETWRKYLDADINEAQISRLSKNDKHYFVSKNSDILEKYGYLNECY